MSADIETSAERARSEHAEAPAFLTSIEAAAVLRLTADTVRRQAVAGLLPGVRLGRHWRFEAEHLHAYLRGEWQPPRASPPPRLDGSREAVEIFQKARLIALKRRQDSK